MAVEKSSKTLVILVICILGVLILVIGVGIYMNSKLKNHTKLNNIADEHVKEENRKRMESEYRRKKNILDEEAINYDPVKLDS